MNVSIVNVLTPNGRRQNVKVQPNTTILKVKLKIENCTIFCNYIYFDRYFIALDLRRSMSKASIRSK